MSVPTQVQHEVGDAALLRVPPGGAPEDINNEQAVLGGMMLSTDALVDVSEVLRDGADFYRPVHQTIYQAALDLFGRGEPVDAITVAAELTRRGELNRVGGAPYLHTLISVVPTAANAEFYAKQVVENATIRRLTEAGMRITQRGYAREGTATELVDASEADLFAVMGRREDNSCLPFASGYDAMLEKVETAGRAALTGISTGFRDLDELTGGLQPGQLIVVAGRPGLGKSTVAMDIVRACSIKHGRPSVFFSLEMSREEIQMRVTSAEVRIPLHHLRRGTLTDERWARLAMERDRILAAPIHIDDAADLTMMSVRTKARRLAQRQGIDLIVVDYLQLMQTGGRRVENRQQEVAEMSRGLKLLAKELGVPVIALSQLNRGPEQRMDKKPMLSDLRESGAVEQDADVVILVHREDAYDPESPRAGEADFIVAKHRNGQTATITVAFQGHYSRFVDMQTG